MFDSSNFFKTSKDLWYKKTSFSRLKVEEHDFKKGLCGHKERNSPQAIQGMWQAYGQMRAARTLARGTIFAGGIFGCGLWVYQQTLSTQKKNIDSKEDELKKAGQDIKHERISWWNENIVGNSEITATAKISLRQLEVSRQYVEKICAHSKNKDSCLAEYDSEISKKAEDYPKLLEDTIRDANENYEKKWPTLKK